MAILESLFASQINWGRIVAMISFLRALCFVLDTRPGSHVCYNLTFVVSIFSSPLHHLRMIVLL